MPIKSLKIHRLKWINISSLSGEDVKYLEKNFRFHPLDLKDCLEGVQQPKLDIYRDYLFIIFHFPIFDPEKQRISIQSLNVFLGTNYLITITRDSDELLGDIFSKMRKTAKRVVRYDQLKNNSGYLLYKIIDSRYHKSLPIINEMGRYLDEVEEEVYSNKNKEVTLNLAVIRRNIFNLRRILEPQLKMVEKLVNIKNPAIADKLPVYFDDVHDYLVNMWSALENYRDTIDSLYNTNESFINQKTNEVIKMLTIISVALLPMTLIASIYGMNVEGLPFAEHPIGLWLIFLLMAGIVFGSIYFAKKNDII
ncbi:magnesium transporter CorA family protein [Patescibacteria group bacterium]|nr:magnesium transporter CorA family protein [Patescibacteria group bacterium]